MQKKRTRRQAAILKRNLFLGFCSLILIAVVFIVGFIINSVTKPDSDKTFDGSQQHLTSSKTEEPKITTATVLSTGDIMVHSTQLDGAINKQTGEYDFSCYFSKVSEYFKKADLNVANLEVTFGSEKSGKYSGYPAFNTPDSLADAIKNSGLNFLVTANNHSYDTGLFGLKRTAQVLKEKGIEFVGTRQTSADKAFIVKNINNINIGIANYTYETSSSDGKKYLNGIVLAEEANNLVNTFSYQKINEFYANAESTINQMKTEGADFIVFYMHWGEEYQLKANTWQKTIAQRLSDLGVNIIIGSHPHVVQPVELIHSQDGQTTTVCLYSTGNFVSNQRQELMDSCPSGHTEDGLLFSFTLEKNKDDTLLTEIDIIPTWVNKYRGDSGYLYTVYPLENPSDAINKYALDSTAANKAARSYERTKAIVSEGLTACQQEIGCEITFK